MATHCSYLFEKLLEPSDGKWLTMNSKQAHRGWCKHAESHNYPRDQGFMLALQDGGTIQAITFRQPYAACRLCRRALAPVDQNTRAQQTSIRYGPEYSVLDRSVCETFFSEWHGTSYTADLTVIPSC